MAQCEAEGRKHPTMDLYVGIFNSKLYTSSRGSTRVGSVDKWSRNGHSAHVESFREETPPTDRSSFQSRSFRDKPPVLSDLGDFNRKSTFYSNGGSARFEMKNSVVEMGYESVERKCPLNDKKSSPHADVGHVSNDKKGLVMDVDYVGISQANTGHVSDEVGYVGNEKKSSRTELAHGSRDKVGSQLEIGHGINLKNSPSTNVGYGTDVRLSPRARMGCGSAEKRISHADMAYIKTNSSPFEASGGINRSQIVVKNSQINVGNGIDDNHFVEYDVTGSSDTKHANRDVSFGILENRDAELRPAHASLKSLQVVTEGALQRSNFSRTNAGPVVRTLDVHSNSNDQVDDGNAMAMKSHDFSAVDGPLVSLGAGLSKADKSRDLASARISFSSSSESARFERKLDSVALMNGAVSTSDIIADEASAHGLVSDLCNTARYQRSGEFGARSEALQVNGRSSSDIHMDPSNVGGITSEKSGELMMGLPKSGNVGEVDNSNQGNANGLVLKNSPSRGHNFVANLRVSGSGSTDSSSSHGGSSHSGSPTAAESIRDSRASSFGNILISKGSPHSVSSRSMGSASISGNGMLGGSKSSFNDIPAPQFRYSTSSGRKSAEIVPNRRSSEMVPNRKSSEMIPNGHLRGAATQGFVGDGMFSSGNVSRGSGNLSSGNNISLNNGNLLVGSTNGNVLSVGGGTKSSNKQGEAVNQAHTVDGTLLKKAQASSDPEEVKNAGNEYYRRGHFAEALMLYNRVVSLCPSNAAYRSNRAAALSGLGRLGEAVQECEDAIRLDSSYVRAHQRVAALYLRLGLTEWAKQHFNAAGQQTDLMEVQRLRTIDGHISRCIEARRRGEWQNVIRESDAAVVAGADSAPQIFGYKSEALLGLHKPDEADGVCTAAQRVERSLVKSGVLPADPFLLIVRAQIDMALGRFEGAVEAAKSASKIDPHSDNVAALLRKAQAVCHTRAAGNDLFKSGRFFEALALYAEGLESDPTNAVLLCNRAACRSKLGQWEKAVEDCNAALRVQPNYTKALMRRANCWTKLERWEDALQDYEFLRRKMPEDLEVARGLFDVHVAIKKSRGEDTRKMKFGGDVQEVLTDEQFQEAISSPGLSVVQFVTRWSERCRQLSPFVHDLCKRNPCVNFVKVDVEDVPYLAKIESVSFIPTFKIYKNGQKVKEILGPTEQSLEYALKHYAL